MADIQVWRHPHILMTCLTCLFSFSEQVNFPPRIRNMPRGTSISVREDARVGQAVFNLFASDAEGDALAFIVLTPDTPFVFDNSSLRKDLRNLPITEYYIDLTVSGKQPRLDFETKKTFNVTIQVTDGKDSVSALLNVLVINVNDNAPTLNVNQPSQVMDEEAPIGTSLNYSISFSDADVGDSVYVGLLGDDAQIMNIDPSSGQISLNSIIDIDPNTELRVYKPVLFATDGSMTTTTTITLTVRDANDNSPVCNSSVYNADVVEEERGSRVVCLLTCTDRDSAYNNNNKLTYNIIQGNMALFSVNNSGAFSLLSPLDYETTKVETAVVKVEDGGTGRRFDTTATVSVVVKPANDIPPAWATWRPDLPTNLTYSIPENIAVGTSILTVAATDADLDLGNEVTYNMVVAATGGSPRLDIFSLDPVTGVLTTRAALERDGQQGVTQYTFILQASDGGLNSHVINRTVYLDVKDTNDNAPKFVGLPYPVAVLQEAMARAGAVVTMVSASDEDSTSTNLTFSVDSVVSGNTPVSTWRFSSILSGQLELASDIDLDIDNPPLSVSVLRLVVRDNGVPNLTGTATLTVSIVPDNEFSPVIISQPGSVPVQVTENTQANTRLIRIEANDKDKGPEGVLVYSITAGDPDKTFSIDSSGWITTQTGLDEETQNKYILTVLISDSGVSVVRSVTTSVTLLIMDVNDNSPICQLQSLAVSVPENTPVNTTIANISCTDNDPGDTLTLSVKSPLNSIFGAISSKVSPKNTTWQLKLLKEVDYDSKDQSYLVEVEVSDGSNIYQVKVTVNLMAVNEAKPVFQTNPSVNVSENLIQNPVIVYQATDTDYSPHDIISYTISSVSNGGTSLFNIESKTGSLLLLSALDYEALPVIDKTYKVVIVAEDGGGLKGTGTVSVVVNNINDNSPVCNQSIYFVHVSEKQSTGGPYIVLTDLICSDMEDGKNLAYMMTQTPGDHFTIINSSILLKSDSLDYETSQSHTLTIKVMDRGTPVQTSTVTVYVAVDDVNDGAPVFLPTTPVNISETVDIGQFVVDVVATDPDATNSLIGDIQYSITDGDSQLQFFIDVRTGGISTRKKLDFETTRSYALVVQATEKGGELSAFTTQIINVIDVNDEKPVCAVTSFLMTVSESQPVNHTVIDLNCTDADAGTILTYSILSGNTTLFQMEGNQVKLKSPLDFEEPPLSHDLVILVSDMVVSHNRNISGSVITGSVDEGPPTFDNDTYTVHTPENLAVFSNIFTVIATDPDSPRDQNGQVKYSFLRPYPWFSIDEQSGQIILADSLDRERQAFYSLVVKAADVLGSNTATVSVIVDDVNDNPPRFKASLYRSVISANAPAGSTVLTVAATDADDPNFNNYGTVRYQMSGSSNFRINQTTGVITSTAALNTGPRLYSLTVTATDSGNSTGAQTGTCVVNIQVSTDNLNAPVFIPSFYRVTVRENQFAVKDVILNVTARDDDPGPDGEFTLDLVSSQEKFYLTQNGRTGEIHLLNNLDFDSGDTAFAFEITATDKGTPARFGTGTVVLLVDDDNDNPPLCPRFLNLDKVEGETNLTRIICSDADISSTLTYAIISTSPSSIQPAVSREGVLTLSTPLDYETSSSYQILLQITDNGSPALTANVTIRLNVIDVNDNDPSFTGLLTFDLPENTSVGNDVLYKVLAAGNDGPSDKITYSLSDNPYFYIMPDTGEIQLRAVAPDYETVGSVYKLGVCVSDTPRPLVRSVCSNITVNIIDCNDEMPRFSPSSYQATVAEDSEVGRSLVTVTAIDKDASPRFSSLTYAIQAGNIEGCFRLLPSGVLELVKQLDFETTTSYFLTLQASDGDYNATAFCSIQVLPVNEHAPTFPMSVATVHVEENVLATTVVFTANATDADAGSDGTVRYNIDPGPFVIDSQSGKVSIIRSLDRETLQAYNLTVRAVDQGTPPKTGSLLLSVVIDDVNDNAPNCGTSSYIVSVRESALSGDVIATLTCVDDDDDPSGLNNALTYAISSTPDNLFIVDQSGVVKLKDGAILDRETESFYTITVTITDQSPKLRLTSMVNISLTVVDVNDNSPTMTSIESPTVPENTAPGTTITSIKASDMDEGINKQLTFQITSGNSNNMFTLNANNGDLVLQKPLDYETEQQHELVVVVRDRGSPARSVTGTLTVTVSDVNDNPPVCATSMYTTAVPENSSNQILVTVTCDDVDVTGLVTYNITSGNDGNFSVDINTGQVRTRPDARLDFESISSYTLEITAFDGIQTDQAYVRVRVEDVNEFAPRFTPADPINVTVPEDADISWLLYEFKATDQDTGDLVKVFSIVSGNSAGKFVLDPQTGKLQLDNILDYEKETSYVLTVAVYDSGRRNDTITLYVNVQDVNDNAPKCQNKSVTVTIPEGVRSTTVYTPSCSDDDKIAILEYSLSVNSDPAFAINNNTGQLSLIEPLDYELDMVIWLQILVKERNVPTPEETSINVRVVVDPVNEFAPVFLPTNMYGPYNIREDTVTGTVVARVTASDSDKGLSHGSVRYTVSSGDPQKYFRIDETTGDIENLRQLDREVIAAYTLNITATDSIPGATTARNATATVKLVVTDVNDNIPRLTPPVYLLNVSESSMYGASVVLTQFVVEDMDEGNNSYTTITITDGNSDSKFAISAGKELILIGQLDYETTNSYELILDVVDGGQPSLRSSGRARVKVLPVNEAAPLMETTSATITIAENAPLGMLVYDANATDIDSELHGQVTYSIDGVSPREFIINPSTGQLFVNAPLDFDVPPNTYTIVIRATDGAGASDPITSAMTLKVNLSDVNDHVPSFPSAVINMTISENVVRGTLVGIIQATDADSGENGRVRYSQTGGNGNTYFVVHPDTGIVNTTDNIDYEMFQTLYISVMAYDGGVPPLTSNCLIKVDIINLNDNYPVISPQNFMVAVSGNLSVGEIIMTFSASDKDTAISQFNLINDSRYFEVNSKSGAVRTKSQLDREAAEILYIQVKDMATASDPTIHTSTGTLTVSVKDINDHAPEISGDYNKAVPENIAINEVVFQINATDIDMGPSGKLTYAITDGNIDGAFVIDSQGVVQVSKNLDRETVSSYLLTIHVSDQGTTTKSSQITANITLTDVNDNSPTFMHQNYSFVVAENSPARLSVGEVMAVDADVGSNARLTYMFDSFSVGNSSHFTIQPSSGIIAVNTSSLNSSLIPSYTATVKVTDAGTPVRSSLTVVTITVSDNKNHPPVFLQTTYSATLNENWEVGNQVLQVSAVDTDVGENAQFSYFMDTTNLDGPVAKAYFQVNPASGAISTTAEINFEEHQTFRLFILAVDNGSPVLTGNTTVIIVVVDINDNNPVFSPSFYDTEVAYNVECSNIITMVTATDADTGTNGKISYFLQTGTYSYLFEVDANNGELKLKDMAFPNSCYRLEVGARDPSRTSVLPAKIRVDTFIPNNVVVSFRLNISRNDFLAVADQFLENVQNVVHTKYPTAIVHLWCVTEYDGVSTSEINTRRRLLADMPVEANIYAVKDNSTSSEDNFYKQKTFVSQEELLAMFTTQDDPTSDPRPGGQFNDQNVTDVKAYRGRATTWWAQVDAKILILLAIIFGCILFGLLLFFILRYCCKWFGLRKRKTDYLNSLDSKPEKVKNISQMEPEIIPVKHTQKFPESKRQSQSSDDANHHKVYSPDSLKDRSSGKDSSDNSLKLYKKLQLLGSDTDSGFPSPASNPHSVTMNGSLPLEEYQIYDGIAYDPLTGRLYQNNSTTKERQWFS